MNGNDNTHTLKLFLYLVIIIFLVKNIGFLLLMPFLVPVVYLGYFLADKLFRQSVNKNYLVKKILILVFITFIFTTISFRLPAIIVSMFKIKLNTEYFSIVEKIIIHFLGLIFGLGLRATLLLYQNKNKIKDFRWKKSKSINSDIHLGQVNRFKGFNLTENNLVHHTQIIGGSGYGKTNLLKNILENRIKNNKCVIFLDFKAEYEMNTWLQGCAKKYNRLNDIELLSINYSEESVNYNPVEGGSASEIVSKIMSSFIWSEPFYEKACQIALRYCCDYLCLIRDSNKDFKFDLHDIYGLLNDKLAFESLEKKYQAYSNTPHLKKELIDQLYSDINKKNTLGLKADIFNVIRSELGKNLSKDNSVFSIKSAIENKKILYLQMNSMKDKISSEIIGKLFLQDLITTVGNSFSDKNEEKDLNCSLVIDEFAAFATANFVDLLNRCRGVGMGIIIAHQSLSDLNKVSENFSKQIEANTANKIMFGTKNAEDAEKFAAMVGTKKTIKETSSSIKSVFGSREGDRGSIRESEAFNVHPNEFKNLKRGEAFCIKSIVDTDWGIVKFDKANHYKLKSEINYKSKHIIPDELEFKDTVIPFDF